MPRGFQRFGDRPHDRLTSVLCGSCARASVAAAAASSSRPSPLRARALRYSALVNLGQGVEGVQGTVAGPQAEQSAILMQLGRRLSRHRRALEEDCRHGLWCNGATWQPPCWVPCSTACGCRWVVHMTGSGQVCSGHARHGTERVCPAHLPRDMRPYDVPTVALPPVPPLHPAAHRRSSAGAGEPPPCQEHQQNHGARQGAGIRSGRQHTSYHILYGPQSKRHRLGWWRLSASGPVCT